MTVDKQGDGMAERESSEFQIEWRAVFDAIRDSVCLIGLDYIIRYCNVAMAESFNTEREQLVGKPCFEVMRCGLKSSNDCPLKSLMTSATRSKKTFERAGRWFEVLVDPVVQNGKLKGVIHIMYDITNRIEAEKKQHNLEEQLRRSQKMEAIGRMAGGVAHDFNNILSIITCYSDLVLDMVDPLDPLYDDICEILQTSRRGAKLTQQLLAFSHKRMAKAQILDPNKVVRDISKMMRRIIGEDIDFTINLDEDVGVVKADRTQLEQVLANLAVNARDAMSRGGGSLIISTEGIRLNEDEAEQYINLSAGAYVLITVSDTGVGVPSEQLDQIFEPFFTTKEKGKGTGLGLSMVYGIVTQLGGCIHVDSTPKVGTTFKIYLPTTSETSKYSSNVVVVEPSTGTETILVVEDELQLLYSISSLLRRRGYEVLAAPNGMEAISLAEQHARIDLLLTDVIMPGMNGNQVARKIRLQHPAVRTIYMSGYADDIVNRDTLVAAGVRFVEKPFEVSSLLNLVRESLDDLTVESQELTAHCPVKVKTPSRESSE